jgi:superoxide dismutase, Cu-Zn family
MRFALASFALLALTLPASAQKHANDLVIPLKTSTGQDAGTATFRETVKGKLHIKLDLKNLPEGDHAVHIHQNPVCDAPDFKGAGGHFNPDKKQHGLKNPMGHHAGDLPENLTVGMDGTVSKTFTVDYLSLAPDAPNSILANGGTSIMIHQKADDMLTDPTGNAGNRIACGVITATPPVVGVPVTP